MGDAADGGALLWACAAQGGQVRKEEEIMTSEGVRICKNPGCPNPVPPAKPGHRPPLTCSTRCRKRASYLHVREEAQQQRQARWQVFLPATQRVLSRVEALGGTALAEQLVEAIRSEIQASGDGR